MYRDRVFETSTTTGTGSFILAGAVKGYRTFSAAFSTLGAYYVITNRDVPSEWEIGSFTVSGTTLNRLAGNVLAGSSGAGTLVNFSSGTKEVFNSAPASAMMVWTTVAPADYLRRTENTAPCCLPEGTLVHLADGQRKAIEALVPGDQVVGRNGQINNILALCMGELGERDLYHVNNSFMVTGDHLVWTPTGWAAFDKDLYARRADERSRSGTLGLEHQPEMNWRAEEIGLVTQGSVLGIASKTQVVHTVERVRGESPEQLVYAPIVDGDQSFFVADGYIVDGFADRRVDFRIEQPSTQEIHP